MTPPVLDDLLRHLDEFFREHLWLLETDPEAFCRLLEGFVTYVACRSYREGSRAVLKRVRAPGTN